MRVVLSPGKSIVAISKVTIRPADLEHGSKAKSKKKRKIVVTGFRHMQGTLFAISAFLRHIQRKIYSHFCYLPVCQQSCFLLTQQNETIFSI
jgi:hypothetical protein